MPRKRKSSDPFSFPSTVELDNVSRFVGDRSKRYRKSNGRYDKDSNHEPNFW